LLRDLPLVGTTGAALQYATPDPVTERLQRIDRDASGQILMAEQAVSPGHRDRYVVSSLIEESIMSSLLEGAATTRREAKEMLRSGRKPTTKGERMVLNNFRAMQRIKTLANEELSPDLIRHLHAILTDRAADPGHYRGPDEEDRFGVWSGERRLYKPPPHDDVEAYVGQVCAFINGTDGPYVHPVIKAVALHFWIGYVHPFEDGNGRTARALFYWFMLREGYWLFEFVSISSVLTDAYAKYARAYLYTETDDNDLTYFLLFHLDVIDRALDSVQAYIRRKVQEIRETRAVLHPDAELNARQIALLRHALQHPDAVYTFASHQTSHGIVYQTARTDLLSLADRGLLTAGRAGRKYVFRVPQDLSERVRDAP
jgi:Fic family protein